MDLTALLEKNKSRLKSTKPISARKPADIAQEDRPYSPPPPPPSPTQSVKPPIPTAKKIELEFKMAETAKPIEMPPEKPATNRQQTDNKVETKWQQTDNKLATKLQQPVNKSLVKHENWQQSGNQTGNTIGNKVATNRQQTDNKVATNIGFAELVGLHREIIIFMSHECKNSRSRITEALTLEYIANAVKHSAGVVKTTLQRLEKKGVLLRIGFKNGRGGWSRYEVPDHIYHDALRNETDNKVATNRQQTDNKVATKPATELATSASSSSSDLKNKTTTTELPEEWGFDIRPYARFGFTQSHIKQLASVGIITAASVEQSLIEFSHDLDNNMLPPIKTNKINFLMGLLRSGHSYVSEGFKNEQDAIISEMARRAEDKRKKLIEEKFVAWEAGLTDDERKDIEKKLPTSLMVLHRTYGIDNIEIKNWMFNYFLNIEK